MNDKLFNEAIARRLGFTFEKLSESPCWRERHARVRIELHL